VCVLLASYPRSGVTFLRLVIEQLYGIPTWTLYRENPDPAKVFDGDRHWPRTEGPGLPVNFIKTHEVGRPEPGQRTIHLVRDGRDATVSYAHFLQTYYRKAYGGISIDDISRQIVEGDAPLGSWADHTTTWAKRDCVRILYDDLVSHPADTVAYAVAIVAPSLAPASGTKIATFGELQTRSKHFFRRGRGGGWRAEWSAELQMLFDKFSHDAMRAIEREPQYA